MKGFVQDIEGIAVKNEDFRQVLYTARNCQLVVMALSPRRRSGRKCISWISSFAWKKEWARPFSTAFGQRSERASPCSSCGDESQHHQYWQRSIEALYALCAAESSGRRCSIIPVPKRRRTTNTSTVNDGIGD